MGIILVLEIVYFGDIAMSEIHYIEDKIVRYETNRI